MTTDFAVEALAKVTVLLAVAWAVAFALRRASAALRHQLWAVALAAALSLPVLMWTLPEWRTYSAIAIPVWEEGDPVLIAGSVQARVDVSRALNPQPSSPEPRRSVSAEEALTAVWALGFAVAMLRLAGGFLRILSIQTHDFPAPVPLPAGVRLLRAESAAVMPLTWGVFRPRILFPAGAETWPEQRFQQILAHELAHMQRRDWVVHMVAELTRAVYWFHPLAWVAVQQLRQEAERACDDIVLNQGAPATEYADNLLHVARTLKAPAGAVASGLAAARATEFERRITAMLHPSMNRRPISPGGAAISALVGIAVLLPLATVAEGQ